jgi:hypothetical protein
LGDSPFLSGLLIGLDFDSGHPDYSIALLAVLQLSATAKKSRPVISQPKVARCGSSTGGVRILNGVGMEVNVKSDDIFGMGKILRLLRRMMHSGGW